MKKIKIIVIEDDSIIAQFFHMELTDEGYEVYSFITSGEEAVIEAKKIEPDLLLMDVKLLGAMDGIDAAKKIIEHRKIPIIFITGYSDNFYYNKAQSVNPIAYLEKPIEMKKLIALINSLFK